MAVIAQVGVAEFDSAHSCDPICMHIIGKVIYVAVVSVSARLCHYNRTFLINS